MVSPQLQRLRQSQAQTLIVLVEQVNLSEPLGGNLLVSLVDIMLQMFFFVIHPSSARALVLGAAYLTKNKQTKNVVQGSSFYTHGYIFAFSVVIFSIFSPLNTRLIRSLDDIR